MVEACHRRPRSADASQPPELIEATEANYAKSAETTELGRVRDWMDPAGGDISVGDAKLKSAKISKRNDKLSVVLKKTPKSKGKQRLPLM